MTLRVAILDFDGTLVESVGIKDRAFEALFGDLPEWPVVRAYHLSHNHTIRFEKFRYIDEEILGIEHTPERAQVLADRFAALVEEAISEAPAVAGTTALLGTLERLGVRVYLLSATPDEELGRLLSARGLNGYFVGVYGYPWSKGEAVDAILRGESVQLSDVVMVGDSPEDAEIARAAGVAFLGRDSGKRLPSDVTVFGDLDGVREALEQRVLPAPARKESAT